MMADFNGQAVKVRDRALARGRNSKKEANKTDRPSQVKTYPRRK